MRRQPIGIFDSGLGGLTVASALCTALPDESIVYLGDTARVPYGTKSASTVVQYAQRNMQFMRIHQVKAVVVACNTVSAQGIQQFTHKDDPLVLGVIEPGAKAAVSKSQAKRIAVLATPGTIASQAYPKAIEKIDSSIRVEQVACPLFVPLAEEGWTDHEVTRMIVETYLKPLQAFKPDTLILGCTHYPLLQDAIEHVAQHLFGEQTEVVNSATVVAQTVRDALVSLDLLSETRLHPNHFFATDVSERSQVVAQRFWSQQHGDPPFFHHVDLPAANDSHV